VCESAATNILVFDDGTLVITDFGQALIAQKRSSERTRRIPQRPGEQAYRPAGNSKETDMGPEYDDWGIACVLIEILVFAARGPEGVQQLYEARQKQHYPTDYYYQVDRDGEHILHPGVVQLLVGLKGEQMAWPLNYGFTEAVLDIVGSMLRIDRNTRMDSDKASDRLQKDLVYWRLRARDSGRVSIYGRLDTFETPAPTSYLPS